jgi:hypothetical protein
VTAEQGSDLTLLEVLVAAGEGLPGILAAGDANRWSWDSGGVVFARLDGDRAEFRLDPMVSRAALRTPDTSPSTRGEDWVAFAPADVDDAAVDRAEAWFLSAYRRAAKAL